MIEIKDKHNCTGCTACYSICPVHCISMVKDNDGFLYPQVNKENCINCNLCSKTCPQINKLAGKVDTNQEAYAIRSKDYKIWESSASGGAFTEICRALNDENTSFYGAALESLEVRHICVDDFKELSKIRRSKYVSSDLGVTFSEIKNKLDSRKRVVFSGTPCQIAGLRSFLKKDYDNLFLIDFICHGVGSPSVFNNCLDVMSNDFKSEIIDYIFRYKNGPFQERYISKIDLKNGESKIVRQDRYLQLFLSQRCIRPVCASNCLYRDTNRQSDITIADFKGVEQEFSNLAGTKYNYTAVIFNTSKGLSIQQKLFESSICYKSSLERIKKDNPLFYKNLSSDVIKKNESNSIEFFKKYVEDPNKAILDDTTCPEEYKKSLKKTAYDFLPFSIRHLLRKIRN